MKTFKFNFEPMAYIYIIAILLLGLSTSCSASLEDEPVFQDLSTKAVDIPDYFQEGYATFLVLHQRPAYERNYEASSVCWKAFPNSDSNVDPYLKPDGFLPKLKGTGTNGIMKVEYNDDVENVFIQPNPYMNDEATFIGPDENRNVCTINFLGENYYMFNPVSIQVDHENVNLINYRTREPISNITLLCDYITYGSYRLNDFEPEDEEFYIFTSLPFPDEKIRTNRVYIYILKDSFNLWEYSRRAGLYNPYDNLYNKRKTNTEEDYELWEFTMEDGLYQIL